MSEPTRVLAKDANADLRAWLRERRDQPQASRRRRMEAVREKLRRRSEKSTNVD